MNLNRCFKKVGEIRSDPHVVKTKEQLAEYVLFIAAEEIACLSVLNDMSEDETNKFVYGLFDYLVGE